MLLMDANTGNVFVLLGPFARHLAGVPRCHSLPRKIRREINSDH
jgi:hypothetical protein